MCMQDGEDGERFWNSDCGFVFKYAVGDVVGILSKAYRSNGKPEYTPKGWGIIVSRDHMSQTATYRVLETNTLHEIRYVQASLYPVDDYKLLVAISHT